MIYPEFSKISFYFRASLFILLYVFGWAHLSSNFMNSSLAYREQLESLAKLDWPRLSCKSVPWAFHTPLCNLDSWSPVRLPPVPRESSSSAVIDEEERVQEPMDADVNERSDATKAEPESITEDGELPTLLPNMSKLDHSTQLNLISKSIVLPLNKIRSQSFKKYDDSSDFLLDTESDLDEPAQTELEHENTLSNYHERNSVSWMDHGLKEFCLVLCRKISADENNVNLEAKVNEYSLIYTV